VGAEVHRLSALESVLLLPIGLLWSRLRLGPASSRTAFWLLAYSALAIIAAYMMAAVWGLVTR
jgi:hydroxylaminobenzene mutase